MKMVVMNNPIAIGMEYFDSLVFKPYESRRAVRRGDVVVIGPGRREEEPQEVGPNLGEGIWGEYEFE